MKLPRMRLPNMARVRSIVTNPGVLGLVFAGIYVILPDPMPGPIDDGILVTAAYINYRRTTTRILARRNQP